MTMHRLRYQYPQPPGSSDSSTIFTASLWAVSFDAIRRCLPLARRLLELSSHSDTPAALKDALTGLATDAMQQVEGGGGGAAAALFSSQPAHAPESAPAAPLAQIHAAPSPPPVAQSLPLAQDATSRRRSGPDTGAATRTRHRRGPGGRSIAQGDGKSPTSTTEQNLHSARQGPSSQKRSITSSRSLLFTLTAVTG